MTEKRQKIREEKTVLREFFYCFDLAGNKLAPLRVSKIDRAL